MLTRGPEGGRSDGARRAAGCRAEGRRARRGGAERPRQEADKAMAAAPPRPRRWWRPPATRRPAIRARANEAAAVAGPTPSAGPPRRWSSGTGARSSFAARWTASRPRRPAFRATAREPPAGAVAQQAAADVPARPLAAGQPDADAERPGPVLTVRKPGQRPQTGQSRSQVPRSAAIRMLTTMLARGSSADSPRSRTTPSAAASTGDSAGTAHRTRAAAPGRVERLGIEPRLAERDRERLRGAARDVPQGRLAGDEAPHPAGRARQSSGHGSGRSTTWTGMAGPGWRAASTIAAPGPVAIRRARPGVPPRPAGRSRPAPRPRARQPAGGTPRPCSPDAAAAGSQPALAHRGRQDRLAVEDHAPPQGRP